MANLINAPQTNPVDQLEIGKGGRPSLIGIADGWRNFFNAVFAICNGVTQSGTTANRPSANLWVGRVYFDTTLGLPIWYKSPGWVKADGTAA